VTCCSKHNDSVSAFIQMFEYLCYYVSQHHLFSLESAKCKRIIRGKVAPVRAMKANKGRRSMASLIPNLGTGWR
jgi:hypothetical protein